MTLHQNVSSTLEMFHRVEHYFDKSFSHYDFDKSSDGNINYFSSLKIILQLNNKPKTKLPTNFCYYNNYFY